MGGVIFADSTRVDVPGGGHNTGRAADRERRADERETKGAGGASDIPFLGNQSIPRKPPGLQCCIASNHLGFIAINS